METLDTGLLQFLTHSTSTFTIVVEKRNASTKLGIDVDTTQDDSLIVDGVGGGMISEWNRENPEMQVQPGDLVVEVNGVMEDALSMLTECQISKRLHIVFSRPPDKVTKPLQPVVNTMPTIYVVSWNILAASRANSQGFQHVDPAVFNDARRRKQAAAALRYLAADIVCLQEVDCPLEELGLGTNSEYDSCTVQTPNSQFERCVIAWRRAKFEIGPAGHQQLYLDKYQPPPALVASECDAAYFRTGSVGLAVELRLISDPGHRCLTVATTHLSWVPTRSDVHAWQLFKFADMVQNFAGPRIILGGDFSWPPDSAPYQFLTKGCGLESIYRSFENTCFTCSRGPNGFATMSDYVWYDSKWMISKQRIDLREVKNLIASSENKGMIDAQGRVSIPSFLSEKWPSDHMVIGSIFELTNPVYMDDEWDD